MESDKIGIGELARRSGLSVSALRFYDGADVLAPTWVDAATGYRTYRPEQIGDARLVADLRRVGMPVADIRRVLAASEDRVLVDEILATHLQRLEDGLADARVALSAIRARLDMKESSMTNARLAINAHELSTALTAVRYAVSIDPELPQLAGVLFDFDTNENLLRLVATDRYRLVVSAVAVTDHHGSDISVIAPSSFVDQLGNALTGDDSVVTVECRDEEIEAALSDGQTIRCQRLDYEFPDYRRLTRTEGSTEVVLDVASIRADLAVADTHSMHRTNDDVDFEVVVMSLGSDGRLIVGSGDAASTQIGVNREFLLQALYEMPGSDLTLTLDGPINPLAIRAAGNREALALLMPVRLN